MKIVVEIEDEVHPGSAELYLASIAEQLYYAACDYVDDKAHHPADWVVRVLEPDGGVIIQ